MRAIVETCLSRSAVPATQILLVFLEYATWNWPGRPWVILAIALSVMVRASLLWLAAGVDSAANDAGMVATPEIASASDPTARPLNALLEARFICMSFFVGGV